MGTSEATEGIRFLTMDKRGNGLSERHPGDVSLDSRVTDLETVVDTVGLERFALGGLSEGGPVAISYAARRPEHVEKLVLMGSYADGSRLAGSQKMREAMRSVVKAEWGMASRVMAELFVGPDSIMDINAFAAYQQAAADPEEALAMFDAMIEIDVRSLLPQITAPTLVVHHRADRIVPIEPHRVSPVPGSRLILARTSHRRTSFASHGQRSWISSEEAQRLWWRPRPLRLPSVPFSSPTSRAPPRSLTASAMPRPGSYSRSTNESSAMP